MKKQRSLKELGFKKQPKKKNNRAPGEGRGGMFPHSNSVSIEELNEEYQKGLIHPTPDAPPDTSIGGVSEPPMV